MKTINKTTEENYDNDLAQAESIAMNSDIYKSHISSHGDDQAKSWLDMALNNKWIEGITIEGWVRLAGYSDGIAC